MPSHKPNQQPHLWLLNPTHSLKNLNLSPLIYSQILASDSFKALKIYDTLASFGKYLKRCLGGGGAAQQQQDDASSEVSLHHKIRFLEMAKSNHRTQLGLFECLLKLHMLFVSQSRQQQQQYDSLYDYVKRHHFETYLASKSNIIWLELALYCIWIRCIIEPRYQFDMYMALYHSQEKKMASIPIFARFHDDRPVEKITMPILVLKLMTHQRLFGTMLPRLPRRFQDDMIFRWKDEMRKKGVSLKRKMQETDSRKRKRDDTQDKKKEEKAPKVEITEEGRARFSKKPPVNPKKKGFLDLSRYVSSQYGGSSTASSGETALNYHSKDTLQIGRSKKKRKIRGL